MKKKIKEKFYESPYYFIDVAVQQFGSEWSSRAMVYRKDTNERVKGKSVLFDNYEKALENSNRMAEEFKANLQKPLDWQDPVRMVLSEFARYNEEKSNYFALGQKSNYSLNDVGILLSKILNMEQEWCLKLCKKIQKLSEQQLILLVLSSEKEFEQY